MTTSICTALLGLCLYSGATATGPGWTRPAEEPAIKVPTYRTHTVKMTGYNAVPEQTDDSPYTTSIGLPVNPQVGAAASQDLIAGDLPYGTVIELMPGAAEYATGGCELPSVEKYIQYRVIIDTMNKRHEDHVDIQFGNEHDVSVGKNTLNAADAIGWCNNVKIRVVGRIDPKNIPETQNELKLLIAQKRLFAFND